jgi:hypothetical protein
MISRSLGATKFVSFPKRLLDGPDLTQPLDYFLQHVIADPTIVRSSEPAASALLLNVTVGFVERHCGQELFVLAPFFLHVPAYQLWHGGCHLGVYVTHLLYFDDVKTGMLSIVRPQDSANADYVRFSVVDRPVGRSPN